ncbi:erythromycin esterase family protein [Micromonospora sp. NPDC050397]|uniref:erythromycin esterase family protein n=1 Tax=Micromonospora sp. NPDC050397 TaxID=3364279 RepID=UPI00385116D1
MTALTEAAARPFSGGALNALLSPTIRLLGLGEPTHGVDAFLELRNDLFRHLVEHEGYRSVTIESDCLMALVADAYVVDGVGTLDEAMDGGFSHGFGASAANRELLRWMRAHNERRPREERLRFYGFDAPLEMTGAASPRPALTALYDYLATADLDLPWGRDTLDELLGADERWTHPDALVDPARSIGDAPEVGRLRLIADDLRALLTAYAPHLVAGTSAERWWLADLHGRTAAGLLRYHAGLADAAPNRVNNLMCQRDAMMAENLEAIVRHEARRGPTLAFAHNSHLQRSRSQLRLGGLPLRWWSAGAIVGSRLGDEYAFVATTFGSRGRDVPDPGTIEGSLLTLPYARAVVDPGRLDRTVSARVPADYTYSSLDPATTDQIDAIVFVRNL